MTSFEHWRDVIVAGTGAAITTAGAGFAAIWRLNTRLSQVEKACESIPVIIETSTENGKGLARLEGRLEGMSAQLGRIEDYVAKRD